MTRSENFIGSLPNFDLNRPIYRYNDEFKTFSNSDKPTKGFSKLSKKETVELITDYLKIKALSDSQISKVRELLTSVTNPSPKLSGIAKIKETFSKFTSLIKNVVIFKGIHTDNYYAKQQANQLLQQENKLQQKPKSQSTPKSSPKVNPQNDTVDALKQQKEQLVKAIEKSDYKSAIKVLSQIPELHETVYQAIVELLKEDSSPAYDLEYKGLAKLISFLKPEDAEQLIIMAIKKCRVDQKCNIGFTAYCHVLDTNEIIDFIQNSIQLKSLNEYEKICNYIFSNISYSFEEDFERRIFDNIFTLDLANSLIDFLVEKKKFFDKSDEQHLKAYKNNLVKEWLHHDSDSELDLQPLLETMQEASTHLQNWRQITNLNSDYQHAFFEVENLTLLNFKQEIEEFVTKIKQFENLPFLNSTEKTIINLMCQILQEIGLNDKELSLELLNAYKDLQEEFSKEIRIADNPTSLAVIARTYILKNLWGLFTDSLEMLKEKPKS